MYVVTFYSFKGGTGRSMALVNVAADLLLRGRKVLMVDFDLEAPGLDTFPMSLVPSRRGGLVEIITDYLNSTSESPPLLEDYVSRATLDGVASGELWLMTAGRQDSTYDSRFKAINWQDFYENEGGFFFFEDLKVQWSQTLKPDYVLIDSRTGHTDIGGICTRQLPDCVVSMFFPNEQNIRGLIPVINDVRNEKSGPLQKQIDLHFVMANVPDLDDEEEILAQACRSAKESLGYSDLASTIHHFSSLSMLEQRLLLIDRPKSKLATEYRQLSAAIVQLNLEDRDGALAVIYKALIDIRTDNEAADVQLERRLQTIRTIHSDDKDILLGLARFRRAQRRVDEALDLFEQVLQLDSLNAEGLLGRAEVLMSLDRRSEAVPDLQNFFTLSDVSAVSFALAARLLIMADYSKLADVLRSPSVALLPTSAVIDILQDLQRRYETCQYGIELARLWIAANPKADGEQLILHDLSLCLIAAKRFEEAMVVIGLNIDEDYVLSGEFNYAMASWGLFREVPRELFQKFIAKLTTPTESTDANYLQCLSLAYWAVGETSLAHEFLDEARRLFSSAPRTIFSAWSYLYRSPKAFRADLDSLKRLYDTGEGAPEVVSQPSVLFPIQ